MTPNTIGLRLIFLLLCSSCIWDGLAQAPGEVFAPKRVVNPATTAGRFRHPFALVVGPNDSLWVTERRGYVMRVSPVNGQKKQLLNLTSQVRFTTSGSGSSMSIAQDGMFGLALHPQLNQGVGFDYVYLAYCYDSSGIRRTRISRFTYRKAGSGGDTLMSELILLRGLPASNDHNGGRLVIGNFGTAGSPDYKLVYTVGDRGANQFSNACDSIESQYIPTSAEMSAGNLRRYAGKIIRLNLDGSIPVDNPVINGVRSHIWSYGHRNPQGLAFERDANNVLVPRGKLYSSEMGPAANDEVNIIDSANNYGWPRISGKRDDNWYRYYKWAGSVTPSCGSYSSECSVTQTTLGLTETSFSHPRLTDPIFDLFPGTPPTVGGVPNTCNWLTYPTLAPSSIVYYPYANRIPGWQGSLLITTLKSSAIYRLKMNANGTLPLSVSDSVVRYFHDFSALNRLRDMAIASDGITMYVLTDSVGGTSGPSAGTNGGVTDRGSILEYRYTGAVLALGNDVPGNNNARERFRLFPNPAKSMVTLESMRDVSKPIHVELVDAAGRVVRRYQSIRQRTSLSLVGIPAGIYFVRISNAFAIHLATEKLHIVH